jgi:hypothetical protein
MISVTWIWRYRAMEDEFNLRQLTGKPCADLVRFMIEQISAASPVCNLHMTGPRGRQK